MGPDFGSDEKIFPLDGGVLGEPFLKARSDFILILVT